MDSDMDRKAIQAYYGKILTKSSDLKTDACSTLASPPTWLADILSGIHPTVMERYYGCGLIAPEAITGMTILDLGSGSGRDAFVLSHLVGPTGRVLGVDMTQTQVDIANGAIAWHSETHSLNNIEFHTGLVEDLSFLSDESVDIVVSNCVVNLSPDKATVLAEVFRILKKGGEFYFSDVYADRRLPKTLQDNEILWGECLGGSLYWNDFLQLSRAAGFIDSRLVTDRILSINNSDLETLLAPANFWSATWRLWKLDKLEPLCEDYGQVVRYKGGIPQHEAVWNLDHHHRFERGQTLKICGNTWRMLHDTRFRKYFDFYGDFSTHFGVFPDCGTAIPFASKIGGNTNSIISSGCC
jgi:arsenite methyltransferase